MASKERPVLVALISTMGIIIAALITSGYLSRTSAANRKDALEEKIRSLEADLRKQREAAPCTDQKRGESLDHSPPNGLGNTGAPKQPQLNASDIAAKLAQDEHAQILASGGSAKGAIAEGAIKSYVFVGNTNTPLLFILDQPNRHFDIIVSVLDSRGTTLVRDVRWYGNNNQFSFTPPEDGAYLLKMNGAHGFGEYVVVMRPLENKST